MNVFDQATEVMEQVPFFGDLLGDYGEGNGIPDLLKALEEAGLLRSDQPDGDVMAFRTGGNNADVISDCFTLGYLTDEMSILDPTYGKGTFWKKHRPPYLIGTDIDPTKSPGGSAHDALGGNNYVDPGYVMDFTALGFDDGNFDATVFDPPYKMQGTSSNAGPATSNAAYGVDREYIALFEQMDHIGAGLSECFRVTKPGGMILVKCMSAVVSGAVVWQDVVLTNAMLEFGCDLVDRFWLLGYRKQPERTHKCPDCGGLGMGPTLVLQCGSCDGTGREVSVQQHARQNASCLLVFRKGAAGV